MRQKTSPFLKKIDWYIIKKFLGTYAFTLILIIAIAVMFDFNEQVDKFIRTGAPTQAILFDYYLNFISYFANLFSPLFTFIAVIFFTSKLANDSEIIAILSSGVSFKRLMRPYIISATIIAAVTFYLNSFVIPVGNVTRIGFQNKYIKNKKEEFASNIQLKVDSGVIAYFGSYDDRSRTGYQFSLEKFKGKELVSKLTAQKIQYDSAYNWKIEHYSIRNFIGLKEEISVGEHIDTTIQIIPSDFLISVNDCEQMTSSQLNTFIDRQKDRGFGNIKLFEIEFHKRFSMSFASFILTIIGVSISYRKMKGGMGFNIGMGLLISFSYLLFMQISSSFAISGLASPVIAVWIPNILYAFIAGYLYKKALK